MTPKNKLKPSKTSRGFNAKSIKCWLKAHMTTPEMMGKYGYTDEKAFRKALSRAFPRWAPTIFSDLAANDARAAKKTASHPADVSASPAVTTSFKSGAPSAASLLEKEPEHLDLPALLNLEQKLNAEMSLLTDQYAQCSAEKERFHKELVLCERTLNELLRLIQANKDRVIDTVTKYLNQCSMLEHLVADISAKEAHLAEVQCKIVAARTAFIYVYEDSSIEVEYSAGYSEIDAENARISVLADRPGAEDLTVREVQSIVKLLRITSWFQSQDIPFEVSFGNHKAESFYKSI